MAYTLKLKNKEMVANGTMAFHFEKPKDFTFKAGQSGDFSLVNPNQSDGEGNTRAFTISCAPFQNEIMFTTRMRDTAFKRQMNEMSIGSEIYFDAPFGSFTLHNNASIPAVFLTGGIGITPVRSILLQAEHDHVPHKIIVFYSNKTPKDAAFLAEFEALTKDNASYSFIATMTNMENSGQEWDGETGFFTQDMLTRYITDLQHPIYYLSGPKDMVTAVRKTLNHAGIDDDNIRTEEFPGY